MWNASATDIRLGGDSQFNACSGCSSVHQNLTVSLNGQLGGSGDINGQLTGVGLSGAGIAYAFAGNDPSNSFQHEHVNGAVAFALNSFTQTPNGTNVTTNGTAAINSNNIEYALGLVASGLNATAGAVQSDNLTQLDGGAAALSRVTRDANGIPTVFDGKAIIVIPTNPACGPTPCPAFVNETPAKLSILQTDVNTAGGGTAATLLESGRDPITGIVWGRYGGGKIAVFDRIGGAGAFAPTTIDVATQNWHGIFGPQQSGPVTLPTSGTFAYTFVGGTSPTDNFGNVGTLTSANLTANFTNMTVNAGVNLTVAGNTWIANANAAPIQKGTFFQAQVGTTTSPLSVTVNGSAAGTAGSLVGGFVGTSGQGLAMAYSLNRTPGQTLVAPFLTNGTTVSGVAAFKR